MIHFCGHSDSDSGILLLEAQGQPQPVSSRTFAMAQLRRTKQCRI
jgi:hypothetical protein